MAEVVLPKATEFAIANGVLIVATFLLGIFAYKYKNYIATILYYPVRVMFFGFVCLVLIYATANVGIQDPSSDAFGASLVVTLFIVSMYIGSIINIFFLEHLKTPTGLVIDAATGAVQTALAPVRFVTDPIGAGITGAKDVIVENKMGLLQALGFGAFAYAVFNAIMSGSIINGFNAAASGYMLSGGWNDLEP